MPRDDSISGLRSERRSITSSNTRMQVADFQPVPLWLRESCVLTPLRLFLRFFVYDLLQPEDDVTTASQRAAVGVSGAYGMFRTLFGVALLLRAQLETPAAYVSAIAPLLLAVAYVVNFAVLKLRPTCVSTAADFFLLSAFTSIFSLTLTKMTYPAFASFAAFGVVCAGVRSRRAMWFAPLSVVSAIVSAYNYAALPVAEESIYPLAALPGPVIQRDFTGPFFDCVVVLVVSWLSLAVVVIQLREADRQARAAKATVALASLLAHDLGRYDTGSAEERLCDARSEGVADEDMLDRFGAIVTNLNRYRPHLPNWILPEPADEAHESHLGAASRRSKNSDASSSARAQPTTTDDGGGRVSPSSQPVVTVRSHAESHASDTRAAGRLEILNLATAVQHRRVSVAHVHFQVLLAPSACPTDFPSSSAAPLASCQEVDRAHAFVDQVHGVAASCSGAVHGFVGDVVSVTWNAVQPVAMPESKAATFLTALAHPAAAADDVVVAESCTVRHGAAAAGKARVLLAGRSRQQALLVSLDDDTGLHAAMNSASKARRQQTRASSPIFVCDDSVYRFAQHAVTFRGHGTFATAVESDDNIAASSRVKGLYEVVRATMERQDDREWMYVLERAVGGGGSGDRSSSPNRSTDDILCEVVDKIVGGDCATALSMLRSAYPAEVKDTLPAPLREWMEAAPQRHF